jgi:dipeptidyl aminopeptidase/acylaminoacyl peptidase
MRRPFVPISILALLAWVPTMAGAQSGRPAPTVEQFLKIRTPGSPVVLPDGSLLLRDWPEGVYQLYHVTPRSTASGPSYKPGEATFTRMTSYADGLSNFSVSPTCDRAVLLHAAGGNENTQLSLVDLHAPDKAPVEVLANPKVQASVDAWKLDGTSFVYTANDESPNDFHIYRYDIASGQRTKLLGEAGTWFVRTMTRDGSRLLVENARSASDSRIFELDAATGKLKDLSLKPSDTTAACSAVGYLPGEKSVLVVSDYKGGVGRLYVLDLKSGAVREPLPALAALELDGAQINDAGDLLAVETNEDGYGALHLYSLPDFKPLPVPPMERGVVTTGAFRGHSLIWQDSNAHTPGVSYLTTWPARGGALETHQLTYVDDQGVDLAAFPLPELVHYTAFDGRQIPAFLFLPPGAKQGAPVPFVVYYHGGPEGQNRPGFNASLQFLLARGYGLLEPNVRGSTGYGRAFQMLDDYQKRWDSVRDGVDAAEWLVQSGYARPGRIATYGGSYGGFMSVACNVEDQERVDAGKRKQRMFGSCIDVVGIVNMKGFLEKTSGYRRKLREAEYGPLSDSTFLASISSIRRVDKLQVPVFVAHGFNDPRVPVEEAMQLAIALKERGRNPRVFIAPDEGHGFVKLDNRIYFNERAIQFLDETIGAEPAASAAVHP